VQAHAVLVLRLFTAGVLVWGTQDNVLSAARMEEFAHFLAARGTPLPQLAAPLSAWAQFLCGLLLLAGAAARWAGALMVVNFLAALLIAHRGAPFQANIAPLAMLSLAAFFALHGAGPLSLDARWAARGRDAR
jgi:putative oxidoreductase